MERQHARRCRCKALSAHEPAHPERGHCSAILRHARACCEIPETCCPPRRAGNIGWSIQRGAAATASIRVRNVGAAAREFHFSATPLSGLDGGLASLEVQPNSILLQPSESTLVQLTLKGSLSLRASQTYHAEVLLRGAWEQCFAVSLRVLRDPFDSTSVEQGGSLKDKIVRRLFGEGRICWTIDRGVQAEGAVTVHNMGGSAQIFTFEPSPWVGAGASGASVAISPLSLSLGAGQSGVVRLTLENSVSFQPRQAYHSTLLIHGYHEHPLALHCDVKADASDHGELEQGEIPTRVRAHHWYDHFQCTEPCPLGSV